MSQLPATARTQQQGSLALDVFRGFAAIAMVFNHTGVAWLSQAQMTAGWSGFLVFLGSMAPVLFFFSSGVGQGLSPGKLRRDGGAVDLAWKVTLLLLADRIWAAYLGTAVGLDFFGYIALSMVVVSLVDLHRRAVPLAVGLAVLSLVLRFAVGPRLPEAWLDNPLVGFFTGMTALDGLSYLWAPWIAYPLLGYAAARLGVYPQDDLKTDSLASRLRLRKLASPATLALFVTASLAALAALAMGKIFHRWSTMNLPFFVASLAVVAGCMALSQALAARAVTVANALFMRGVAAFLIVPAHTLLQELAKLVWPAPWSPIWFLVGAVVVLVMSYALSNALASKTPALLRTVAPWMVAAACGLTVLTCVAIALGWWVPKAPGVLVVMVLGQCCAAVLLGARPSAKKALA
jgi:hypothetical protein